MNAPSNIDPVSDGDVVHWLTIGTRDERFVDNIFAELGMRLQRAGIPVKRASLHLLIPPRNGSAPDPVGRWHEGGHDHAGRLRCQAANRIHRQSRERNHGGAAEIREHLDRDPRWAASMPSMASCARWG